MLIKFYDANFSFSSSFISSGASNSAGIGSVSPQYKVSRKSETFSSRSALFITFTIPWAFASLSHAHFCFDAIIFPPRNALLPTSLSILFMVLVLAFEVIASVPPPPPPNPGSFGPNANASPIPSVLQRIKAEVDTNNERDTVYKELSI